MAGARRSRGSADSRCPGCGQPLLVQWVGTTAALKASVDLPPADEPRPWAAAKARSTDMDLVWCLPRQQYGPLRLRWAHTRHPPDCPHQHLTSHQCPPTTLF
ncbi:hypothetical protein [Streptomyces sp. TOR3209]|uniref:hypothetical protein n=1 Tax=Streptomyces sp. TOR3209 TaxID=1073567 RepID=UPI00031C0C29|nr:hypothetical protein [Streptomyces sp. TOR3209]